MMHHACSPVVSTRPRRARLAASSRSGTRSASVPSHRRPLEALESRVLFAAGDFDLTFGGGDGAALINFGPESSDFGYSIATLPDGKIIVGGSVGNGTNTDDVFGVSRLNPDGSLDLTFGGGDGLATLDFGPDADLQSIAVAPDGKIVAVGKANDATTWDWAIARFNADGSPDATFGGGDGMVTTDFFGFGDTAYGVDVQPDGKIVVTGVATGFNSQIAVARYNIDGALDTTFHDDGQMFADFFGGVDFASSIKVQPDNKLIVVGGSVRPGAHRQFVLLRVNPDGTPDATFGSSGQEPGQATADFGSSAFGKDVELQADGKYVVGGWVDTGADADQLDFAVARFNANGTLDTSFGTGGRTVFTGTGGDVFRPYGLEIQQNGKILLGGTTKDPNYDTNFRTYAGVARLDANGMPDATFGTGGLRQFTIPGTDPGTSVIHDLELQPDGSILLAGYPFGSSGGIDFAVVRLVNDDGQAASISGVVFNDLNENGMRDAGEAGLSGWTVFHDLNNNGFFDSGVATVASADVPKPISPVGTPTVISDLNVSGVGSISDLDVTLNITHSWQNDLTVSLISPAGREVLLFDNVGTGIRRENFYGTVLDDEAAQLITQGSSPFTGSYRPENPLSAFDGTDPNGTWQLKIVDTANEDGGSLDSWSLTITTEADPSVTTGADGSYTFAALPPGTYSIREVVEPGWTQTSPAGGAHVVNLAAGQAVTGRDFGNVDRVLPPAVVGRHVFYNRSAFDGNDAAANAQDDNAIATDKEALLPVHSATRVNVTSYSKGINGVMVDMARMSQNLDADDFEFKVGTSGFPGLWTAAPAPLSVTERLLPNGNTRVTVVWGDNLIRNAWLQVTVRANADTGLGGDDVFYFGNLIGETVAPEGGTTLVVNSSDVLATRAARRATAAVTVAADHNRDGRVNILDELVVRRNLGRTLDLLIRPRSEAEFAASAASLRSSALRSRGVPITRSVLA